MSITEQPLTQPVNDQSSSSQGHRRSNSYDQAVAGDVLEVKNPTPKLDKKPVEIERKENDFYIIKWIEFNHEILPILLQNVNGPCPLLAITNILLLRKRILLPTNATAITTDRVVAHIANYILSIDLTKLSNEQRANYEANVEDALAILPKLRTGIDVNLKFHGVDRFEFTRECIVFDILSIQLLHGWVIDPQNHELQKIVSANGSSYNQLVEKMLQQQQSSGEVLARESLIIEQFFEESRSQLTHYGILQLNETMRDNQLAVLFRNNHFSTIWKNNKQLLLLVSDQGYVDHPGIVFETLTDTDNNSLFTNGYGQVWKEPVAVDSAQDRDLAIAMQKEEQRQYQQAQLQQQQQQQPRPQGYYYEQAPRRSGHKHRRSTRDDHRSDCTLS